MTQTEPLAPQGVPKQEPEKEKEEFYLKVPDTVWHWSPTEAYLTQEEFFPRTSYAASLALINAVYGVSPEILLVRQNENDPEKFTQLRGGTRTRPEGWKMPIGRFYPYRYIGDDGKGLLDNSLWDTVIEEFREETGIDFIAAGENEEENALILESLKRAPVAEYRKFSKRPPSKYHIDRVHFLVAPRRLMSDKNIWKDAVELRDVQYFPLFELPRRDLNGEGAEMIYSHVQRLVEFFEHPAAGNVCWQSGISDDAGERIRNRFPDYKIPNKSLASD